MSYCWGTKSFQVLTEATLASFQAGVNAGSFPATIRDCIVVARALGIRYLWVDAYCIMQADGGGGPSGRLKVL
ncbi:hypothetical protein LTR56_023634 [Elasticomyces elasticus]|nr:hypothetical protein LTR56_023634 [Elasticomyces elasticus]KAK3623785.1 hypothetical protein LTR22_024239 [Elasticomyces elasticus]KAK4926034.1 hypothetical protein LTR49_006948 [Elasticomyces elasticus]KAK5766195.1 hypothetical protein LTS12_003679 [Elasticomyces elasticus]